MPSHEIIILMLNGLINNLYTVDWEERSSIIWTFLGSFEASTLAFLVWLTVRSDSRFELA